MPGSGHLKLLVDRSNNRVLFGQAGNDFMQDMRRILRSGCVHQLCKGVELASPFHGRGHHWLPDELEGEFHHSDSLNHYHYVFRYIVTDDLVFTPISTLEILSIFQKFGIRDVETLREEIVTVSYDQMKKLATVSLFSKTVLSDVFLTRPAPPAKPLPRGEDVSEEEYNEESDFFAESVKRVVELSKKKKKKMQDDDYEEDSEGNEVDYSEGEEDEDGREDYSEEEEDASQF